MHIYLRTCTQLGKRSDFLLSITRKVVGSVWRDFLFLWEFYAALFYCGTPKAFCITTFRILKTTRSLHIMNHVVMDGEVVSRKNGLMFGSAFLC